MLLPRAEHELNFNSLPKLLTSIAPNRPLDAVQVCCFSLVSVVALVVVAHVVVVVAVFSV